MPQQSRLRLSFNTTFKEVKDPKGLFRDIKALGLLGNGDVKVGPFFMAWPGKVMALMRQVYEKHSDSTVAA